MSWRVPALSILLWFCATLAQAETLPGVENAERAHVNYMLHCQGCHGPDGRGRPEGGVLPPDIRWSQLVKTYGHVHENGRRHAAFDEANFALMMRANFEPYTAGEVTRLRAEPLQDVLGERERLINQLQQ